MTTIPCPLPASVRRPGLRLFVSLLTAGPVLGLLLGASPQRQRPFAAPPPVPAGVTCTPRTPTPAHIDFGGKTLTTPNFAGMDLRNANFKGAVLVSPVFIRADLRGADFSGATIQDSRVSSDSLNFPADFTLAKLGGACFLNTTFQGVTYFTYADLTATDFSYTDLRTLTGPGAQQIVFGTTLRFTAANAANGLARPRFQGGYVPCDWVAQFGQLDLTNAQGLHACAVQLKKQADLSGAMMAGVDFSGMDLSGVNWAGAVLERANFEDSTLDAATGFNGTASQIARLAGARFNKASAVGVDFSNAQLYGADFTYADLSNANFTGSFLTAGGATNEPVAAKFDGARLRNVTFANAKLQSVSFVAANLYGGGGGALAPNPTCQTDTKMCGKIPVSGGTCSCASMAGANLTSTDFSGAFLFGVDFANSGTVVNGTKFDNAVLVASNFGGVNLRVASGAAASFKGAMLQGANLGVSAAGLTGTYATLTGAYLDFETVKDGNDITVLMGTDHTRFRNWRGSQKVCLLLGYDAPSKVPEAVRFDCPDGSNGVCGQARPRAQGPNKQWASGSPLKSASPVPGWYSFDSTYELATTDASVCDGVAPNGRGW